MSPQLELYVLSWGVYPRRILLYLSEKGLMGSPIIKVTPVSTTNEGVMVAPGKPAGSVPILKLPDGKFIKQSIAIMEYLEDICDHPDPSMDWQIELANAAAGRSLRGRFSDERARTRELLALADEATSQFCFAGHKGTALFVPLERTSAVAADLALEFCKKTLKSLDNYLAEDSQAVEGSPFSMAHCVLFSLLQFSKGCYGVDLLAEPELAAIRDFQQSFEQRGSLGLEEPQYPEWIQQLASQWLPVE